MHRMTGLARGLAKRMSTNRLEKESSPYLQQHKHNPVDWYPWGREAFEAAKARQVPILLSIGYSTCHWCHVMERESFESPEIAGLMNDRFVSVKVDREERPDVDRQYMRFVQAITGSGGWPLTVFLTPELVPFFGGTYFPPHTTGGHIGFTSLLRLISEKWQDDRAELERNGQQVLRLLAESMRPGGAKEGSMDKAYEGGLKGTGGHFLDSYDRAYGGFGGAPKFPSPPALSFLAALCESIPSEGSYKCMTLRTLEKIAQSGLRDHIEGGFHRYAVDRKWHLPHFEKMLYDQGQLLRLYAIAYMNDPKPVYKAAMNGIMEYVEQHLTSCDGAFFCAEDADSLRDAGSTRKLEGRFALWSKGEIEEILPPHLSAVFCEYYGVTDEGNIDPAHDPHGDMRGLNVLDHLNAKGGYDQAMSHLDVEGRLAEALRIVRDRRAARPRPDLDDKILTGWNGLMISGLCRAYQSLGFVQKPLAMAKRAAHFILEGMCDDQGLGHVFKADKAGWIGAFADDYAFMIQALLDLYQVTLRQEYLEHSIRLQGEMTQRYWDGAAGAFMHSASLELPSPLLEDQDGAEPNYNSIAAMNLLKLSLLTDSDAHASMAERILGTFTGRVEQIPWGLPSMLEAYLHRKRGFTLAVISGPSLEAVEEFRLTALESCQHDLLVKFEPGPTVKAHVCLGTTCSAPVTSPADFATMLRK